MRNNKYFDYRKIYIKCLQYYFGPLIKYELNYSETVEYTYNNKSERKNMWKT